MPFIPYGKQWIDEDDIAAVLDVLKSDYLTNGPAISKFEKAICDYTGAKYAVAVSNATAALHIAIQALNIEDGCEAITSPNTFVASSNSMIYNNLIPVFADIDKDDYNIDPEELKQKITEKTKLLIPVHFAGRPCKMEEIRNIAKSYNLFIIEDASHAIGSEYDNGMKVGSCCFSDMTVFSFHPVKTMTTGEGGVITTNNDQLYHILSSLRSHGITRDASKMDENHGPWYYEMHSLGFNYRMTDIQAALGTVQLGKLDDFSARRAEIIRQYNEAFEFVEWIKIPKESESQICFHLYVIQIDFNLLGMNKSTLINKLRATGIGTQVHYIPVHSQPYYRKHYNYKWGDYPIAEEYYLNCLSLPLYPKMSDSEVSTVIQAIRSMK